MEIPQIRRVYNRAAGRYDLVEWLIEFFVMRRLRRELLQKAEGMVLEIGIGTGANLCHYPPGVEVIGIDVSEGMLEQARRKAARQKCPVGWAQVDGEALAFPDGIFDTVVCSFTLCTVPHPLEALREMTRVMKPGGRLLLLEHIRSYNPLVAWIQERASPSQEKRFGCSLVRRTQEAVTQAGLVLESLRFSWLGVLASMIARRG